MVSIKNPTEIAKMRKAASVLKTVLAALKAAIKPGVTGHQLDLLAQDIIKQNGCTPNFLGYYGFPASICVSVNNQLIHGIPNNKPFKDGDLVSVDAGCAFEGYHSDAAFTTIVGKALTKKDELIVQVAEAALTKAINILRPQVRIGDIGAVIQEYVESFGFHLPINYSGHGIGTQLHEDPAILNVGKKDTGMRLQENMVICIEPMVQMTTARTKVLADQWTVISADGLNTAHFEHTILITKNGCEVLTQ